MSLTEKLRNLLIEQHQEQARKEILERQRIKEERQRQIDNENKRLHNKKIAQQFATPLLSVVNKEYLGNKGRITIEGTLDRGECELRWNEKTDNPGSWHEMEVYVTRDDIQLHHHRSISFTDKDWKTKLENDLISELRTGKTLRSVQEKYDMMP